MLNSGHGSTNAGADCPFPVTLEMSMRKGLEDHVNSRHCFCFVLASQRTEPDSNIDFEALPNDPAVSLSRFGSLIMRPFHLE